jgi:hypothetical protein
LTFGKEVVPKTIDHFAKNTMKFRVLVFRAWNLGKFARKKNGIYSVAFALPSQNSGERVKRLICYLIDMAITQADDVIARRQRTLMKGRASGILLEA